MPGIFLGDEDKMINTIDNVLPLTWCLHSCEGTGLGEETQEIQTNQIISGIDEMSILSILQNPEEVSQISLVN